MTKTMAAESLSETIEVWQAELIRDLFPGSLIVEVGRSFLGAPYRAGTLEQKGREKLVVNLTAFDCTTFVETVLALTRCVRAGKLSAPEFRKNLKYIRYRSGIIDGYASRLHYFTDWLRDNEQKKVITDVSRLLGGKPHRKKIDFMTRHHDLYPALSRPAQLANIKTVEKRLTRKTMNVVTGGQVFRKKAGIQQGDIIAFTTDQPGLDVAHVGFAVKAGRSLRLLHASSKEGSVVVSKETLAAYFQSNPQFKGMIVSRFLS